MIFYFCNHFLMYFQQIIFTHHTFSYSPLICHNKNMLNDRSPFFQCFKNSWKEFKFLPTFHIIIRAKTIYHPITVK